MKILIASWLSTRGGEEKHVFDTVSYTASLGNIEMHLALPQSSPWFSDFQSLKNLKLIPIDYSTKVDIKSIFRMCRLLQKEAYDVVHIHGARAGWLARISALLVGHRRVVWTMHLLITDHVSRQPKWTRSIYASLERFLNRRTTRIIAVSESLRQGLLASDPKLDRNQVVTIPNGIPEPKAKTRSDIREKLDIGDRPLGIAVGKLQKEKGFDILIQALDKIPKSIRPHVAIAGTGMLKHELEELAHKSLLSEHFHLLGFRSDVIELLATSDFFIMPSRYEGFPISLLEAMSLGKPIIASAVNGIPEAIENGVNGVLVRPEDEISLAKAIQAMVDDPVKANQMGERAFKTFQERYTIKLCCERINNVYFEVAG